MAANFCKCSRILISFIEDNGNPAYGSRHDSIWLIWGNVPYNDHAVSSSTPNTEHTARHWSRWKEVTRVVGTDGGGGGGGGGGLNIVLLVLYDDNDDNEVDDADEAEDDDDGGGSKLLILLAVVLLILLLIDIVLGKKILLVILL